jgi:hypothetical protein
MRTWCVLWLHQDGVGGPRGVDGMAAPPLGLAVIGLPDDHGTDVGNPRVTARTPSSRRVALEDACFDLLS